ncbi:MAG: branched-chain amino acid ABC transporter permease [Bdellovibrionales bacterium]|nr:branched-chain amino acid ABC transporter permease [Bdellovibrionales bacterium]
MEYVIHLSILVCIYLILAQSLNLSFGRGRLLNLAHVALYGIGAYCTALLSTELGYGFWVCAPVSMAISAFAALLVGLISVKLSHDYFAVGTLAFAAMVTALMNNWRSLTRGVLGIPGIPRPTILDLDFYDNSIFFTFSLILVACSFAVLGLCFRGRLARKLAMQAEDEQAAQALGVDVRATRNDAFIISALFAGLAGCLYSYYLNFIDPSTFGLDEMVFVLSIVIVGRPGSFWGTVGATVFLVLLPEPLRFLQFDPGIIGPARQLIYATVLFLTIYQRRYSLFPPKRTI